MALIEPAWLAAHLTAPRLRIVECSNDQLLYRSGHLPGAVALDWLTDLQDATTRDLAAPADLAARLAAAGITPATTIVLYGDQFNLWAAYAAWVLHEFGHRDVRLLNGGRAAWAATGLPLTRAVPDPAPASYPPPTLAQPSQRAYFADVFAAIGQPAAVVVDLRPAAEFNGAPPDPPLVSALRYGHIPGAVNLPWHMLAGADQRLKPASELHALFAGHGVTPAQTVICSCLVGVLSSYAWFVLHHLLGYPAVRNYDGGWAEWGNLVGVPIE